jgi:hypothetical protein
MLADTRQQHNGTIVLGCGFATGVHAVAEGPGDGCHNSGWRTLDSRPAPSAAEFKPVFLARDEAFHIFAVLKKDKHGDENSADRDHFGRGVPRSVENIHENRKSGCGGD